MQEAELLASLILQRAVNRPLRHERPADRQVAELLDRLEAALEPPRER
jgi:hypothetical protein